LPALLLALGLAGPVLLAAGLWVRPVALAMLLLTAAQGRAGLPDEALLSAALFGWYVAQGAGPISLDGVLARGLASSALPFAARAMRVAAWFDRVVGPLYRLALRLWLAAALIGASASASAPGAMGAHLAMPALPQGMGMHGLPGAWALGAGLLLALGLFTPVVCLAWLLALASGAGHAAGDASLYGPLLLALIGVTGAGRLSLDALIAGWARAPSEPPGPLPHVVIVGAGFGGMACAAGLWRAPLRVTLIDRHNYHLFQPLLYQVATGSLSPADIAAPVRAVLRGNPRLRILRGEVSGVDRTRREITVDGRRMAYDHLVIATGATHGYFGRDDWATYAPGLKTVEDATNIRGRILSAFEEAEATEDPARRRVLLTFLIVGAGPTGVELAGAIAELARNGLEQQFRAFDPATARVILVQAGPRVLPGFPASLSAFAQRSLQRLGVEVRLDSRVESVDADGVMVSGERIPAATVLWAAGVVASPAARWLAVEPDRAGRVPVGPDLSVPGLPEVFAIGDTALAAAWNGQAAPGLAPAAKQMGAYAARVIAARVRGEAPPPPFRYRHQGSLATIGRKSAVADFGRVRFAGALAWWLWGVVHILFLVGLRNRASVMLGWMWSYVTFGPGVRLITGDPPRRRAVPAA
jgi:NADH dehydrogenase/putative oxidoreductase